MPATSRNAPSPLDRWLDRFDVRTFHSRTCAAPPQRLWESARAVRVRDTVTLRPLIALRFGPHAPPPDTTFADLLRSHPFALLEEREHLSISGVAGRLWSLSGDYERLTAPAQFMDFARPGGARVALLNEVRPHPHGSQIVTESRVQCVDRAARLRFRPYWALVGPFARFIRSELLAAAVRAASRSSRATS